MVRLVLATANPDKAREIAGLLSGFELVPRPAGLGDVDETEDTLEGNARLKALAVSSLPARLHGPLLRFIYRETLKYLEWLKKLRQQGPANARRFLEYMVEQEEVQLEMMRLALAGRYAEIARCADDFFLKYDGSVRFFDDGEAGKPC